MTYIPNIMCIWKYVLVWLTVHEICVFLAEVSKARVNKDQISEEKMFLLLFS